MTDSPPKLHSWNSGDYPASLASTHSSLHDPTPPPYATDPSGSPMFPTSSPGSGQRMLDRQHGAEPSGKVGSFKYGAEAYASAGQATATARQQQLDAAKVLPFAVNSGEGGAEAGHVMHLKPHAAAEPASKVGGDAACHYLKPHGAAEPSGKVGGDAAAFYLKPHVIAEPSGKIGERSRTTSSTGEPEKGGVWDKQQVEEAFRQRAVAQAAARTRNAGTPGLLG